MVVIQAVYLGRPGRSVNANRGRQSRKDERGTAGVSYRRVNYRIGVCTMGNCGTVNYLRSTLLITLHPDLMGGPPVRGDFNIDAGTLLVQA